VEGRLRFAWRAALARPPEPRELAALGRLYREALADYRSDPAAARRLLSVGPGAAPAGPDLAELAAWATVARVILNLNETITRS
jgi:hypothetical protein